MKTQSLDTSPEAEHVLVAMLRKAPVWKRFRLVQALTQGAFWSQVRLLQDHHGMSEQEAAIQVVSATYGATLAQCVHCALETSQNWHVQPINLLTILLPLVHLFEERNIPYYLGGSIASSLYGMQQLASDIDLVVDLHNHLPFSSSAISELGYVFDENDMRRACSEQTSFSLLHLDSLMKVDIIIAKQTRFDTAMRSLVTPYVLDTNAPPVCLASALEMIVFKLRRYHQRRLKRRDGMEDDAEWNDLLGMLKVQGPDLDLASLEAWVRTFSIMETWQQARVDAGLSDF